MSTEHPKILAIPGSARKNSLNKRLLNIAVAGAEQTGVPVTTIDLNDFPMPIYDGDLEDRDGIPATARSLRAMMLEHDAFMIACPEYNGSVPPLLKNAIDWVSRGGKSEDGLAPYRNKLAVIMSASPGSYGGLRALLHLRTILQHVGMIVLPEHLTVGNAMEFLTREEHLQGTHGVSAARNLGHCLATMLTKFAIHDVLDQPYDRRSDVGRIRDFSR